MKDRTVFTASLLCILLAAGSWMFLGCELESANSVTRETDINVAGVYMHPTAGSTLVSKNSGEAITRFDLRQSGDQLEAIDNNNSIWRGTLGRESDTLASFVLTGETTAGQGATADGTIEVSGSSATMRGTWTEASYYGVIYGQATVPLAPTNAPDTNSTTTVATPSIVPSSLTFTVSVTATISIATSGATIRYTTNGSDPTSSSGEYSSPLVFNSSTTLKARGFKSGMNDSSVATAVYTKSP